MHWIKEVEIAKINRRSFWHCNRLQCEEMSPTTRRKTTDSVESLHSSRSLCVTSPCHAIAWPRLRFGSREPWVKTAGVSDVGSVHRSPLGQADPGSSPSELTDAVSTTSFARPSPSSSTLSRPLYSSSTTALSFIVYFFDGCDKDPRWFGSEHSLGVGGHHKTTTLITSYHCVPAALTATALERSTSQTSTEILPTSCSVQCEKPNLQLEVLPARCPHGMRSPWNSCWGGKEISGDG